ncbi:FMN-binding protein [uncultured Endozoicomonas sp.]|uniref:FMN-binding protein n=1 Tax=uncultured Endozoicomonas sp. TaxID=432652 RepID=UPI002602D8B1|nr:FMN-binding protein [uncultured Endozoicomonas sp.]
MSCQNRCDKDCHRQLSCQHQKQQPEIIGWRFDAIKLMRWLVLISFVVAYWLGQGWNQPNTMTQLQKLYPEAEITAVNGKDSVWQVQQSSADSITTYTAIAKTENSYGGPLQLITLYGDDGRVKDVDLLNHTDTPAYIQKLRNRMHFEQYENQPVVRNNSSPSFDAVSGATISSDAIMRAHFRGLEEAGQLSFGKTQTLVEQRLQIETQHYVLLAFLILAVASQWIKHPAFTLGMAVGSLILMGFWLNQMFTASTFTAVSLSYTPSVYENLSFWILSSGILFGILFLGKNIYCGNICPFSALQLLLNKITGLSLPLPKFVQKYGSFVPKIGLWLVIIIGLLTTVPIAGSYEPFSMIFSLQGVGIQWAILPLVVIGGVFVPKIFCRYFCPAGQGLDYLTQFRNWLAGYITKNKRRSS